MLGFYNFPHRYFSSWILVLLIVLVSTTLPLLAILLFLSFYSHSSHNFTVPSEVWAKVMQQICIIQAGLAPWHAGSWTPQEGGLVTEWGKGLLFGGSVSFDDKWHHGIRLRCHFTFTFAYWLQPPARLGVFLVTMLISASSLALATLV